MMQDDWKVEISVRITEIREKEHVSLLPNGFYDSIKIFTYLDYMKHFYSNILCILEGYINIT